MIFVYILAAVIALLLTAAWLAYRKAFHVSHRQRKKPYPLPGSEQYARVKDQTAALYNEMAALAFEEVHITAFDGVPLRGRYYHLQDGAPLQIQFHGYRSTGMRDFCGGHKLARSLGHNTLVVDQRAHGRSGGHCISFGVRERRDCLSWSLYARQRFGPDTEIFLTGVSMGAATVLMAAELDLPGNVRGVIADSPYSSPEAVIRKVCRDMQLPPALAFPLVRLGARIFGGFDPCSAGVLQAVQNASLPMLVLHGEDDRFVPCGMSREIRDANPARIRLETFPGAGHGLSYVTDTQRYAVLVEEFIRQNLKKAPSSQG